MKHRWGAATFLSPRKGNPGRQERRPSKNMKHRLPIYIFGWPSHMGGADTKLAHLLWLLHQDYDITVVPNVRVQLEQAHWRAWLRELGVKAAVLEDLPHKLSGWGLSLCNGAFWGEGVGVEAHRRGLKIAWSNEMMWHHPAEIAAVRLGLVEAVLYTSEVQRLKLEESEWAVNPFSFVHGFIAWGDGEVLGEKMVSVSQPLPELETAPPGAKKGWETQVGMSLKCLSGEDKGMEARFTTTSVGGTRSVQTLAVALADQVEKDPTKPVPVVALRKEHYQHKSYGKIYTPLFELIEWVSMDGEEEAKPEPKLEEPKTVAPGSRRRRAAS